MNNVFRLSLVALMLVCLSAGYGVAFAQTPTASPTPDPLVAQITQSTASAFVGGISNNGRFVVFESNGDLATVLPTELNRDARAVKNTDRNREIFLYDYAQRRIFQITNTTSARVDATKPDVADTALSDFSNIEVEVSNNRPVISRDGRWIVFSSNADTPSAFDGGTTANRAALKADGNQEIFLYRIPETTAVDLRTGTDPGFTNLREGVFTRITNTPASRLPTAGKTTARPFVADDNRSPQLNDRGSKVVFVSTRNFTTTVTNSRRNPDANPEIFAWQRTNDAINGPSLGTISQITDTTGAFIFNDNPSISGDTASDTGPDLGNSVIAFISNATAMNDNNGAAITLNNADGNAEVFVVKNYDGALATGLTQVTRTARTNLNDLVNLLNPGPRLSRNGGLIAFETVASNPKDSTAGNQSVRGMYVYEIASDTFLQIGPRGSATDNEEDILRFPVFTGDGTQLVFTSALNFTPTGGTRVAPNDTTGLNPANTKEIFAITLNSPLASTTQSFRRISNTRSGASMQPFVSNTTERIVFSFNAELGGGNADLSAEAFYLIVPPAPAASDIAAASSGLAYFTGATRREVATPVASPTPTPSPAPSTPPVAGLSPNMIGIVRAPEGAGTPTFAATATRVCDPLVPCEAASEIKHRPSLPVELNGVSLSVNNAAAGLYFVSPKEIQFVVPVGLAPQTGTNTYPVVINVREGSTTRTIRSVLQVPPTQPDIFTRTEAPTRASAFNITTNVVMGEPPDGFPVTTTNAAGESKPTVLAIFLTGITLATPSIITVNIGDRTLTGTVEIQSNTPTDLPGVDQLNVQLRSDMAGLGDQPLIVTVTTGGQTFTSRPAATAPRIRIR